MFCSILRLYAIQICLVCLYTALRTHLKGLGPAVDELGGLVEEHLAWRKRNLAPHAVKRHHLKLPRRAHVDLGGGGEWWFDKTPRTGWRDGMGL